nr:hypothetical protein [Acidobacteriota bacterium]
MAHDNFNQTFDQHDSVNVIADKVNPLPRSILRREDFVLLDGDWRFTLDVEDEGLKKKWFVKHNYTVTANFPGSIESYFAAVQDVKEDSDLYATSEDVIAW